MTSKVAVQKTNVDGGDAILADDALTFVAGLAQRFSARIADALAARAER
ncbi:MAG: hypothetical protein ACREJX_07790, partial [Polyangiaceae bacterium]